MPYLVRQILFSLFAFALAITVAFFLPQIFAHQPLPPSFWQGYFTYLADLARGNLGTSTGYFTDGMPVASLIGNSLPWTLLLVGISVFLAILLGTALGAAAAWRHGGPFDTLVTTTALFLASLPYYFIALQLIYTFAVVLHWFPVAGAFSYTLVPHLSWRFVADAADHAVLPAISLIVVSLGLFLLPMRNAMLGTTAEEYLSLAQAKGLPTRSIILRYAMRNAVLPPLHAAAVQTGYVVSGAFLVEFAFSYPGVGLLFINAISNHDYPTVRGVLLLSVAAVLLASFVASLVSIRLDPRLRET